MLDMCVVVQGGAPASSTVPGTGGWHHHSLVPVDHHLRPRPPHNELCRLAICASATEGMMLLKHMSLCLRMGS